VLVTNDVGHHREAADAAPDALADHELLAHHLALFGRELAFSGEPFVQVGIVTTA